MTFFAMRKLARLFWLRYTVAISVQVTLYRSPMPTAYRMEVLELLPEVTKALIDAGPQVP